VVADKREKTVSKAKLISVILATYNWPQALELCLQGLSEQTDISFEVIIADDGSREETTQLIRTHIASSKFVLKHEWQPDIGFRKSKILNQAISASSGDYLVFLDGDCLVQPDFIEKHRLLSQVNAMVTGSRILLKRSLSQHLCQGGRWSYSHFMRDASRYRLSGQLNRLLPLLLKLPDSKMRVYKGFVWRRIKGCNMAAWRDDVLRIGGFDEGLVGWGHEDADFVFRLHQAGVRRKSGAWATEVLHLWHPSASKENAAKNAETVRARIMANAGRKLDV